MDLSGLFHQYLKTTDIPTLAYHIRGRTLEYRWTNCIDGYAMPVDIVLDKGRRVRIHPTTAPGRLTLPAAATTLEIAPEFYALARSE
jgi:hypothetical protein